MTGPLNQLRVLHGTIDDVKVLEEQHQDFMQCKRGCSDCCQDDLTVFSIEAQRIEAFLQRIDQTQRDLTIHPAGSCAFLHPTHKACQVYEVRPYVYRTQGLPLDLSKKLMMGSQSFVIFARSMMTPSIRLKSFRRRVVGKLAPLKANCGSSRRRERTPIPSRSGLHFEQLPRDR